MGADVGIVGSVGKVVGAKLTRNEIGQINKLVEAGLYLESLRLHPGSCQK